MRKERPGGDFAQKKVRQHQLPNLTCCLTEGGVKTSFSPRTVRPDVLVSCRPELWLQRLSLKGWGLTWGLPSGLTSFPVKCMSP